jgi:hypothetical protein
MLEHVALGQSRFMTPGVAPDPRGVLLGRYALLLFSTLEGVVSWFRLYSAEASLDELLTSLEITRVRTPLQSREMVVRIPATSSYTCDRAARLARLIGGTTYTGTSKHFVKYRDDRSPYGYDAIDVQALPQGADFMLHGDDFTQIYTREGELPFAKLLFRLSLRRIPGGDRLSPEDRGDLLLVVQRGLADGVIRYLWRNRIEAEVGLVKPRGETAFGELGTDTAYMLLRTHHLPERIVELFLATPGIDVFRPVAPSAAVQVGYAHVIDLSSCTSLFPNDDYYVFWGRREGSDRVDVIAGPLELSSIADLTRVELELEKTSEPARLGLEALDPIGVTLRLAPSLGTPRRVTAALIPLPHASWVKRLVYMLPPSSLRGHRVAVTERGILVVASENIDVLPLGQLLCELSPGLLVPLGMDVVPRVAPDVLARSLNHAAGVLTVFTPQGAPFQINETALQPLDRRAIARIEVERAEATDVRADPQNDPTVTNDPVGRFALWGMPALPPAEKPSDNDT